MGAPKNNQNNKKEITASSFLQLRVKSSDKGNWIREANKHGNGKLAPWVIETLNAEIKMKQNKKYEVAISHEGGFFFSDENNESCDGSQNHDISDFETALKIYNANNYGSVELREYQEKSDEDEDDEYVILMSKHF